MSVFTALHLKIDSEAVGGQRVGEIIKKISVCNYKTVYDSPEGVLSYCLKVYIRSFYLSKN